MGMGILHRSVVRAKTVHPFRPPSELAISASISASAKAETRAPKSLPIYDARWDHRMSRHSYKWDITHVQRGAVACGDQEPASSRGGGGAHNRSSIATDRGRYYCLPTVQHSRPGQCVRTQTWGSTTLMDF